MCRPLARLTIPFIVCAVAITCFATGYATSQWRHSQAALLCDRGDVASRLTAPNSHLTALLVREHAFDLNFRLYLVDQPTAGVPCQRMAAVWWSPDYDPDSRRDWHQDLEWSADSTVITVRIEEQDVYAYDLANQQGTDQPKVIEQLRALHP